MVTERRPVEAKSIEHVHHLASGERLPAVPTNHIRRALASHRLAQQLFLPQRGQQAEIRSASAHLITS